MLRINPISDRLPKVIKFHASDDLIVAHRAAKLVGIFFCCESVSFDQLNRKRNRAIDAAILFCWSVHEVNQHLASFADFTLCKLLHFAKRHASVHVADF